MRPMMALRVGGAAQWRNSHADFVVAPSAPAAPAAEAEVPNTPRADEVAFQARLHAHLFMPIAPYDEHRWSSDLVRELLEWDGYRQTLSVFKAEVPPGPMLSRDALERRANVVTAGPERDVHLLYRFIRAAQDGTFSEPPSRR